MWCFSHIYLAFPGWGAAESCGVSAWGWVSWINSLILSESYQFLSLYYVISDNLCNLLCLIVLTYMGRVTLISPQKVSLGIKWKNVSESPLQSVKCYLNEWKEVFLLLLLMVWNLGDFLSLRNLLIRVCVCPYAYERGSVISTSMIYLTRVVCWQHFCCCSSWWTLPSEQESDLYFCLNQLLPWNISLEREIYVIMSKSVGQTNEY